VTELAPRDADDLLKTGTLTLVDVRPADERAIASVNTPFRTLDGDERVALEQLPKDTPLAFLCHRGGRSLQAAEHFRGLGFTHVYNVTGGIDAWSDDVDNAVPKY
jgi:monothiol glutaredoxin